VSPQLAGFLPLLAAFFGQTCGDVLDALEAFVDGHRFLQYSVRRRDSSEWPALEP